MHQDIRQLPRSLEPTPLLITKAEFIEEHQPIINAMNPAAPFGGLLYASRGPDFDILCSVAPTQIWTLRAAQGGVVMVSNGLSVNDGLGHFMTRQHHPLDVAIEVVMQPEVLFENLRQLNGLVALPLKHALSRGMQVALAQWNERHNDAREMGKDWAKIQMHRSGSASQGRF